MSREQFTPGPWWWEDWDTDDGPNTRSLVARPETRPHPSTMFPDLPNRILCDEEGDCTPANKALIASAPDLLAACEAQAALIRKLLPFISFEQLHDIGMTPTLISVSDQVCSALDKARGESEARDG